MSSLGRQADRLLVAAILALGTAVLLALYFLQSAAGYVSFETPHPAVVERTVDVLGDTALVLLGVHTAGAILLLASLRPPWRRSPGRGNAGVERLHSRRRMKILAVTSPFALFLAMYVTAMAEGPIKARLDPSCVRAGVEWCVIASGLWRSWTAFMVLYALSGIFLMAPLAWRLTGSRARAVSGLGRRGWRGWARHLVFWVVLAALPWPGLLMLMAGSYGLAFVPLLIGFAVWWWGETTDDLRIRPFADRRRYNRAVRETLAQLSWR